MALNRRWPLVASGRGDRVYATELVGIHYGAIIVTAADFGRGPKVRCPACLQHLPLQKGWLGQEITCPRRGCDGRMRVNPFVTAVHRLPPLRSWWQFWRRR
jgi:hypothetical protein